MDVNDDALEKLASPSCGFVRGGTRCNEPGREFENRSLCEVHIVEVVLQRTKIRRRNTSLQELEMMHAALSRDIAEMRRR